MSFLPSNGRRFLGMTGTLILASACVGGRAPNAPPAGPQGLASEPPASAVDVSPIPEPQGLLVVGRIPRVDGLLSVVGRLTNLPLPTSRELARSLSDDAVVDVLDPARPLDGALAIELHGVEVESRIALSIPVKGFEEAKRRLGARHRLIPGPNDQYKVEGLVRDETRLSERSDVGQPTPRPGVELADETDDEANRVVCILAHAASGVGVQVDPGRLVCGPSRGLQTLVPYLTRTVPRESWSSDVHLEVSPEPLRALVSTYGVALFPSVAYAAVSKPSGARADLIAASIGELAAALEDVRRMSIDGRIGVDGVDLSARIDFEGQKSVLARAMSGSGRAAMPPPALVHLPEDTDTAFFGYGSDAKIFDRPRELLTRFIVETLESTGLPGSERKAIEDLLVDKTLPLLTNGASVYAKGYDAAALERALKAFDSTKPDDAPALAEAKKAVAEQLVGWHLVRINEPVAKVGPTLKDWSAFWARPAVRGWRQKRAGPTRNGKVPAPTTLRLAPLPATAALPPDSVHLEISVPRNVEDEPPLFMPPLGPPGGGGSAPKAALVANPKPVPRSPIVFHVFAVPDGAATWIAFGLDPKLVATKAASVLATAPEAGTLGRASPPTIREGLAEAGAVDRGGFMTVRGFAVLAPLFASRLSAPQAMVDLLASMGSAPIFLTERAEGPRGAAKAGSAMVSLRMKTAAIGDMVKLVRSLR